MKGRRLLKFMYINLFFPVICLYILPQIRLEINKMVANTLLYTPLEVFMLLSFLVYGILLAVLIILCADKKKTTENLILLIIGIISVGVAMYFIKKTVADYYLSRYSYPYAALYLGVCISLTIKNMWKNYKNFFDATS